MLMCGFILLQGAQCLIILKNEAENIIHDDTESLKRLEKVKAIISGFETPYGMELLATTHWIASHQPKFNLEQIIDAFHRWNARKAQLFSGEHIEIAWEHLRKNELER